MITITKIKRLIKLKFFMKRYLVGGAVRDKLLGKTPKDLDYVVIGETNQSMLSIGFEQVGNSFPVFLNPDTGEEYALARKERKTDVGHLGFETVTEGISLEDDLFRRDLTINAMALDKLGNLIDPYNGKKDLENQLLKHVSIHFKEDPLRALRVARFAAQTGFTVAKETIDLINSMTKSDVLNLPMERVKKELDKALLSDYPELFFEVLKKTFIFDLFFSNSYVNSFTGYPIEVQYGLIFNKNINRKLLTNDEFNFINMRSQIKDFNKQEMLKFITTNRLHQHLNKFQNVLSMMQALKMNTENIRKSVNNLNAQVLAGLTISEIKEKQLNCMVA